MAQRLKFATGIFLLLSIIALGDVIGLIMTLRNPAPAAAALGVSTPVQIVRAIVLLLLAVQIAIGACVAWFGLIRRGWTAFRLGALLTTVGLALYGCSQLIHVFIQLRSISLMLLGVAALGLSWLTLWLGRSPVVVPPQVPVQAIES